MSRFLEALAKLPGGMPQEGVDWQVASRYLREHYLGNRLEMGRREKAARRQRFYMSAGDMDMVAFIKNVVKDPIVQQKRIEFVEHAKFNNVLRRTTHELASCYSHPATRTVSGDDNNERYQEMQRRVRMDEVMLRANRLAVLHRNIVVFPRVRDLNGKPEPVLDVITPDSFFAVSHPLDPLALIALVIDVKFKPLGVVGRIPRYMVWTASEWFYIDESGIPIGDPQPHTTGRIPGILFSLEPPSGQLLDVTTGDDLEAAHRAVWFINILLLKEAKSATKQHILQGDLSSMARQQAADTDVPIEAPEGSSVQTIDNSMDLDMYLSTAKGVYETAAANYGLPPSVLNHSDVQSAEARELQRVPLREIRLQQQIPFRDLERELAVIQSEVYRGIEGITFSPAGWSIDFSDPQTPLGTKDALEVFKQERELGLTSTIAELLRRNPDLSDEQARTVLERFIEDELKRNEAMRPLQAISGSMGAPVESAAAEPAKGNKGPTDLSWVKGMLGAA